MSHALLTLAGVHMHIGAYHILHGVDLVVPRGELTLLLGRNGASKTTTLRTITSLWRASGGNIRFDGADITRRGTLEIALLGGGNNEPPSPTLPPRGKGAEPVGNPAGVRR